jgi:phosphoribosylformylglycinamidine (FGAM) synthase-like enzyme
MSLPTAYPADSGDAAPVVRHAATGGSMGALTIFQNTSTESIHTLGRPVRDLKLQTLADSQALYGDIDARTAPQRKAVTKAIDRYNRAVKATVADPDIAARVTAVQAGQAQVQADMHRAKVVFVRTVKHMADTITDPAVLSDSIDRLSKDVMNAFMTPDEIGVIKRVMGSVHTRQLAAPPPGRKTGRAVVDLKNQMDT